MLGFLSNLASSYLLPSQTSNHHHHHQHPSNSTNTNTNTNTFGEHLKQRNNPLGLLAIHQPIPSSAAPSQSCFAGPSQSASRQSSPSPSSRSTTTSSTSQSPNQLNLIFNYHPDQNYPSALNLPSSRSSSRSSRSSLTSSQSSSSSSSYNSLSPRAAQDLISRLDATPTLLPQNLANLITASSLVARVSIRSSAFFLELILESLRYSTTTSLGITRRALISAVGSARAIHCNSSPPPHPQIANPITTKTCRHPSQLNPSYFDVLDHYTNLGIYLVHHVFTMAELLSIAGLDLTHSVISTGFGTAEGSVMLLDSIFGSNESSRALSAIIMLVRRELLHDPHFTPSHSSTLTGLVALTKAITAFACLQLATTRRTLGSMKMRVVWDATIIVQSESESNSLINGFDYQPTTKHPQAHSPQSSVLSSESPTHDIIPPVSFPITPSHSRRQSIHKSSESGKSPPLSDLRSTMAGRSTRIKYKRMDSFNSVVSTSTPQPQSQHCAEERQECQEIEFELTQFLADGDGPHELYPCQSDLNPPHQSELDEGKKQLGKGLCSALYQTQPARSHPELPAYPDLGDSKASSALAGPSSAATYQLTRLTTTTTRTTTTTTTVTSSNPLENPSSCDHPIRIAGNLRNPDPSSNNPPHSKPSRDSCVTTQWPNNFLPTLDSSKLNSTRSRIQVKTSRSDGNLVDSKFLCQLTRPVKRRQDQIELDTHSPSNDSLSKRNGCKSMPSSPRCSPFPPLANVVSRALSRSKTHSDLTSMYLDPYYLVYPIPVFTSSQSPPSSPSLVSEESSEQFDDPVIDPNIDRSTVQFPSTISDLHDEDQSVSDGGNPRDHISPGGPSLSPKFSGIKRPCKSSSPQTSSTSVQTMRTRQISQAVSSSPLPPSSDFPSQSLIKNLGRFMRYSSAAYGQQFLRIMGIGVDSFNYPNTKKHSANDHAFASHVGLAVDQIILSSFAEPHLRLGNEVLSPLVHYVSVDHSVKAIVLTCRGTLGLSDILVDLTCEYEPIAVEGGDPNASYLAHSGMLHSALRLRQESSTVHEVIKQALIDHPSYGLIITGHSLGGGVAALLAVLCSIRTETFLEQISSERVQIDYPPITTSFVTSFRSGFPPGRPIHSYAYGTPAVASLDLSQYTKGLVTTVCNGIDVVPTLSLGVLHDLKSIAVSLHEEESVALDIVSKVIGLYTPGTTSKNSWTKSIRPYGQSTTTTKDPSENFEEYSKENVILKDHEIRNGVGENRANSKGYLDPALEGSKFGRAESSPELGDWLWSLRRTMKAVSDAEKLYPPGDVWHVESYEVFVVKEDETKPHQSSNGIISSNQTKSAAPTRTQKNRLSSSSFNTTSSSSNQNTSSRTEGRRIILRACDDIQARFSEPIFGKTMFHDHIPSQYELVLELLEAAIVSNHDQT